MAELARQRAETRRQEVKDESSKKAINEHVAYLYGRVEVEIEHYSRSNGIPFSALASGVATLLQGKKGG